MNEDKSETEGKPFDIVEVKERIEKLLIVYRAKKDELELAEEEWDIGEIEVSLEECEKEIKLLKEKVRKFEQEQP
jgi:hypothetical protein